MKVFTTIILLSLSLFALNANATLAEDRAHADSLLAEGEDKKAFKAYRDLARNGDHDSQYLVSTMYATGTGTKADPVEAYGWAAVASEIDMDKLNEHKDGIYNSLSDKDKKKAEKKGRDLINKYGMEAQALRQERLTRKDSGGRNGSCTGSRLSCRGNIIRTTVPTVGGAGAPPVADGGN